MKKKELKSLVKSKRKAAENNIKLSLIRELKEVAGKLGQDSKKLNKEIEKGSKSLAKKLAKKLKIDKSKIQEAPANSKTGGTPQKTKTAARKRRVVSSSKAAIAKPQAPSSKNGISSNKKFPAKNGYSKPVTVKSPVQKVPAIKRKIVKNIAKEDGAIV